MPSALRRDEFGYIDQLRVFHKHGGIEEAIPRDDISRRAGFFEHTDGGLSDHVVYDDVVVAREKDARLSAVKYAILTDAGLIALDADAIENGCGEGFVALRSSIVAVNENVDLGDAGSISGNLHAIGLRDENVGGNGRAGGDGGTWRPNIIGHNIVGNRAGGAESNLNAILRRAGCWAQSRDNVPANDGNRAFFIGSDTVLLEVVNGAMADFDCRGAAIAALHEDSRAALAAIQRCRKLEIADRHAVKLARSILE